MRGPHDTVQRMQILNTFDRVGFQHNEVGYFARLDATYGRAGVKEFSCVERYVRQRVPLSRVRSNSLERQRIRDEASQPPMSSARAAEETTRGEIGPAPAPYLCTG
jgi:hypothetical protein